MNYINLISKVINQPGFAWHTFSQKVNNEAEDLFRNIFKKDYWLKTVNQKEIRIAGMRRTGNHAILSWMQAQQEGSVWHLNNVKVNENPYRYKYQNLSYYFPQHQWSINNFKQQVKGELTPKDCLLYSYEDYELEKIFSQLFESKHDLYLGKTNKRYDVLIIRDPFNLFASRIKNNFLATKSKTKTSIELWLDYAREFLNETNYLQHNKVCINYNLWVQNKDYRQEIAKQLDINFTDAGIDNVSGCGGGSSFDGRNLDGKANQMDVNNRWKQLLDHDQYRQLFNHEELIEYSLKIFGHIPGTEVLFPSKIKFF
ncbi:hypothetical protein Sta7437_0854 [Stanieria cyanosphaera PCC 7437]|uniref:Sulfotransferase n=1 Tax=Stanieria cyanosphaera (strain ATCC 29371 / PCC 7437) TaxID=111780 RepID=K9XQV4_STAC7|nr:hypothetical protein [Stanieria cyanosphaera]AFZ34441.1 hypothetical protein Sta7437_0854 [Stanieria cyanosphaera PCC 7437]